MIGQNFSIWATAGETFSARTNEKLEISLLRNMWRSWREVGEAGRTHDCHMMMTKQTKAQNEWALKDIIK